MTQEVKVSFQPAREQRMVLSDMKAGEISEIVELINITSLWEVGDLVRRIPNSSTIENLTQNDSTSQQQNFIKCVIVRKLQKGDKVIIEVL